MKNDHGSLQLKNAHTKQRRPSTAKKKLIKLFFKKSECSRHSQFHRAPQTLHKARSSQGSQTTSSPRFCHHYWHQTFAECELYASWPFCELQEHFTCIRSVSKHVLFSAEVSRRPHSPQCINKHVRIHEGGCSLCQALHQAVYTHSLI